jgi:guanosine-3',5'-bis(diphosphate) 3'-pyrophosphohydrolase
MKVAGKNYLSVFNKMEIQTLYQNAIKYAAQKHNGQEVKGINIPYLVHVCNVAMEILIAGPQTADFNLGLALQVALLHDTIEDTNTSFEELHEIFGLNVANGVLALSKNESLPKDDQMSDCLMRIKNQSKEVWAVKLADRITNLQAPPVDWTAAKKASYLVEARHIYNELKEGNAYLAERLKKLLKEYNKYL